MWYMVYILNEFISSECFKFRSYEGKFFFNGILSFSGGIISELGNGY